MAAAAAVATVLLVVALAVIILLGVVQRGRPAVAEVPVAEREPACGRARADRAGRDGSRRRAADCDRGIAYVAILVVLPLGLVVMRTFSEGIARSSTR